MPEQSPLRITLPYFAFLRGLVQGLKARPLWERYLTDRGEFDVRVCRGLVRQLQRELGAIARRQGRPEVAAVLRQAGVFSLLGQAAQLDSSALDSSGSSANAQAPSPAEPPLPGDHSAEPPQIRPRQAGSTAAPTSEGGLPTLDEIRARYDPDVFSEAELVEIWREEAQAQLKRAPSPSGTSAAGDAALGGQASAPSQLPVARRARRMAQRLEALSWLERLYAEPPQPGDPTEAWLEPLLCRRLAAAGVSSLQDLFELANRIGFNWHATVPRLGPQGARTLVAWLQTHEATLGPFPAHALVRQSELDLDVKQLANKGVVLPWELLSQPGAGEDLLSRFEACEAYRAADEWLQSLQSSPNTFRAYRRETERFFLWCLLAKGAGPHALSGDWADDYVAFLVDPPGDWCAPRRTPRWSPAWRPLEGPLSGASVRVARQVVSSLLAAIKGERP